MSKEKENDNDKVTISLSSVISVTSSLISLAMLLFQKFPDTMKLLGFALPIVHLRLWLMIAFVLISIYVFFLDKTHSYSLIQKTFITLATFILIYLNFIPSPNIIYQYTFEPNDKRNACWRVRTDSNDNSLGKNTSVSEIAHVAGKQSLAFELELPNSFYSPKSPSLGQQIDLKVNDRSIETASCEGTWDIPYEGRIQAWVCLPKTPEVKEGSISAELFIQLRDNEGGWNASNPILLKSGKWVLVRWDVEHDKAETWRDWGKRPIAIGIEIKLDEDSLVQEYQGIVYIDEFVILKDRLPYRLFVDDEEHINSNNCP